MSPNQPTLEDAKQQTGGDAPGHSSQQQHPKAPTVLHHHAERITRAIRQAHLLPPASIGQSPDNGPQDHSRSVPRHEEMGNVSLGVAVAGIECVFVRALEPVGGCG
mmetsp:Transcript_27261/g.57354  ORF Transcript_27261/g.57354 Transcript_27261/m.57354 type:complete len:106 (+) Transcript_27261:4239-4556(+)